MEMVIVVVKSIASLIHIVLVWVSTRGMYVGSDAPLKGNTFELRRRPKTSTTTLCRKLLGGTRLIAVPNGNKVFDCSNAKRLIRSDAPKVEQVSCRSKICFRYRCYHASWKIYRFY